MESCEPVGIEREVRTVVTKIRLKLPRVEIDPTQFLARRMRDIVSRGDQLFVKAHDRNFELEFARAETEEFSGACKQMRNFLERPIAQFFNQKSLIRVVEHVRLLKFRVGF